jgi:hypothetical protein
MAAQRCTPKPQVIGGSSTGVNARQPRIEPGQVVGHYITMDPVTGQRKWEVPLTDMAQLCGHAGDRWRARFHRQAYR